MNTKELLKNIGTRTNGDLYFGVVGPVRSGKSTFIKKFMELAVIPNITDESDKKRAIDELPQSGVGKTIMTTEPKFVPNNSVTINVGEELNINVRLVDCVGYVIDEAKGYKDEDGVRMVKTPWFEDAIPFDEAAKIGTQKVINDHSTIGIVVTTDGSITDIERKNYVEAENEIINELIKLGKPFIVLVNSKDPTGDNTLKIVKDLESKYNVPVLGINIETLNNDDVGTILKEALYEFPLSNIEVELPSWVSVLDGEHWLRKSLKDSIYGAMSFAKKVKDVSGIGEIIEQNENIVSFKIIDVDTSSGIVKTSVEMHDELYEKVLKEIMGFDIDDPVVLLKVMQEYSKLKKDYESLSGAIEMAKTTGYGFATPGYDDIVVEKPELVKQGNRYGVKVKASAPTLHIIKVDVETSFEPIIGVKEQSEVLVQYLQEGMEVDPKIIFNKQMFGRNMGDVIKDGINSKLSTLPDNTRIKLQNLMKTLANKGKTNLIAIVF